jgi:DNA-binding MarR family transcriptional regulator
MPFELTIALLKAWNEFLQLHPEAGLAEFGNYLQNNSPIPDNHDIPAESNLSSNTLRDLLARPANPELAPHYEKEVPIENEIGILIGRMGRFVRLYAKKAFLDAGHIGLDEFGFLAGTLHMGNPRKSDIIWSNLHEPAAGGEILKRLVQQGWISESPDTEDRRARRIQITPEGIKLLNKAFFRISQVARIITKPLTRSEMTQLLRLLIKLDNFHSQFYATHKEEPFDQILHLIERLNA